MNSAWPAFASTRGWEDFKEDEGFDPAPAGVSGFPATANAGLLSLAKSAPYHGTSPYWRVGLFTGKGTVDVNGRFTYAAGRRSFVFDETAVTAGPGGAQTTTTVFNQGNAQRPVATGNLNIAFRPSSKLYLINSTAVYNARTQGDSAFTQFSPGQPVTTVYYNYLSICTLANDTVLNYQVSNAVGLERRFERPSIRRMRRAFALLLLAGCVNREYRFERLDGDQAIRMPLKFEGFYGLRDGAVVNGQGRFADGADVVTMNFTVNLGPPPQFRSGAYEAVIGGKKVTGNVDCPSLSYFGDQSASPSVGGVFVLKDENNRPAYRVRIPATTLTNSRRP